MTIVNTQQGDLFGQHGWLARPSDPETSAQAAEGVVQNLRVSQQTVLWLFQCRERMTFDDLIHFAGHQGVRQSESGLRTRTKELVTMGLVRDSGERSHTKSGRRCVIWELVK